MSIATVVVGTPLRKKLTVACTSIAAVCGAIAGVPPAWTALGLPEAATKTWVGETIRPLRTAQSTSANTLRAIQLDLAEGKRSQTEDALAKWNLELGRAQKPESKGLIQQQIRELQETRDKLSDQIKTLRDIKP